MCVGVCVLGLSLSTCSEPGSTGTSMNQTDRIPALLEFTSEWEKGFRKKNEKKKKIQTAVSTMEKMKQGSVIRCGAA